jgi:threonine aldolase
VDVRTLIARCDNALPGHGSPLSLKQRLAALVEAMDENDDQDQYGTGATLQAFEAELAERFGKEAAVFMPSGTMAQQIALRIWCERQRDFTVAMHPSAHLEFAEQLGYQFLHGIRRLQFGTPEFVSHRPLTRQDFESLPKRPGVVLLELPYRQLGGVLPSFEGLAEIGDWAMGEGIPLHIDGARIWQCAAAYQRPLDEIARHCASLYVSFYKDLGAICGAALLGDGAFIREARLWQRRLGGNLNTQAPFVVSARQQIERVLPKLPAWNARAREVAAVLNRHARIRVQPNLPDVNFFAYYIDGSAESLVERHHALAAETGTFLFGNLMQDAAPGFCKTELHCWENAETADLDRLDEFLARLLAEA